MRDVSTTSSARVAYEILCTDFPQIDDDKLSALQAALSRPSSGAAAAAELAAFPLCTAFLAGLTYGATPRSNGSGSGGGSSSSKRNGHHKQPPPPPSVSPPPPPPPPSDGVVPGLVAAAAPPSRFASVYAAGCVRRALALLSTDEATLRKSLASYSLAPPFDPAQAEGNVPEVVVVAPDGANDGGTEQQQQQQQQEEEVWAAEPDDDDAAYEPIEAPAAAAAAAAASATVAASTPLPTRAQALERLAHLIASLSHEPLVALPAGEWGRLGLGDALRATLAGCCFADKGRQQTASTTYWWSSEDDAPNLCATVETAACSLLRERLLHDASCVAKELPPTLSTLPPSLRAPFLASLVAADGALASPPADAWAILDDAVRTELLLLHGEVGESHSSGRHHQPTLEVLLSLCRWYLEPPPSKRGLVGQAIMATGAPQLLIRLVLPPPPPPLPSQSQPPPRPNGACWEWLLAASSRPHHKEVLAFAVAVPQFQAAVRSSAHLASRPSQAAVWRLLLALASSAEKTDGPAAAAASNALVEEATASVRAVLRGGEGCEALAHTVELVSLMNEASAVLRPLLLSAAAKPLVAELDAARARGADDALKKRAEAAKGGDAQSPAVDNGAEKASELLQRAAAGLKHLSQALVAPGKRD